MKRAVFHTDYFYMILTYGNRHGGAVELAKMLCEESGISVIYINVIMMADNRLPSFDMNEHGMRPCLPAESNPAYDTGKEC